LQFRFCLNSIFLGGFGISRRGKRFHYNQDNTMTVTKDKVGVSVTICTYNGGARLLKVLDALERQDCDLFEIIVVDNNSCDDTIDLVKAKLTEARVPTTLLSEKRQGKRYALDLGIAHAKFPLTAIIDDDNMVGRDYVENAITFFDGHSDVGFRGVSTYFEAEDQEPPWWWEDFKHLYAVGEQYPRSGYLEELGGGTVWGAGLVFRTVLWKEAYERYQSPLSGRNNTNLVAGEDCEFCYLCGLMGWRGYYDRGETIGHVMAPPRLEIEYLLRLSWSSGAGAIGNKHLTEQWVIRHSQVSWFQMSLKRSRKLLIAMYRVKIILCWIRLFCSFSPQGKLLWRVRRSAYNGSLSAVIGLGSMDLWKTRYARSKSIR
jgi:glycosyltransferase involved in cell wall biosynthesis